MRSMKVLRSACMLAVACGMMATVDAVAQARDRPAASQVRKAAAKSGAQTRKPVAQHGKNKRKPAAAKASAAKAKSSARRAATAKKATAAATPVARRTPARTVPPPVAWVPPPLGPERFYPNGIPELRPEFLYPEGPAAPVQQAAGSRGGPQGGEPEWLP